MTFHHLVTTLRQTHRAGFLGARLAVALALAATAAGAAGVEASESQDGTDDSVSEAVQTDSTEEEAAAGSIATVEVAQAGTVTVAAPDEFSNAEVVELTQVDGSYTVRAVVADHELTFYAPAAGTYTVERTGDDVWSVVDALAERSYFEQTTGRDVLAVQYDAESGSFTIDSALTDAAESTAEQPVVALAHFVGVGDVSSGSLEMDRTAADALLGYTVGSDAALSAAQAAASGEEGAGQTDFDPTYLLVEDRDENTGTLLASVLFTPLADAAPCASGEGGVQAFNLVLNPTEELLAERLAAHASFGEDEAAAAAEALAQVEEEGSVAVVANLDTMASYSTGEKIYTLNVYELLGDAFAPGTVVELVYLGAAGDVDAYAGNLSANFEEKLQATDLLLEVDDDGYIEFGLYGGGVYLLGATSAVAEALADLQGLFDVEDADAAEVTAEEIDASQELLSEESDADAAVATAEAGDTGAWRRWAAPIVVVLLADIAVMAVLLRVKCRRCRRLFEARIAALTGALSTERARSGETSEQSVLRMSGVDRFAASAPVPDDAPVREVLERAAARGEEQ